jgi:signal transduction histidine kinase
MTGVMTQRKRPAWARAAAAQVPAGPAMTALRAVAAWTTCTIRCLAIAYIALQVVIWHSFYSADPWRLAGPFAAMAWAAVVVVCLRGRWRVWRRDGLDSAASVLLALGAGWCVPPAVRGDTANWLYMAMVGQLFVPAWLAPMPAAAPLTLIPAGAYLAGTAVTPAVRAGGSSPAVSAALLVAIAVAAWFARRALERSALAADATLAKADREARKQRVALSRTTERREHERLLHDTVLNTLTAVGRAGGTDASQLVARCRRDVALLRYALSDPGDPAKVADRPFGGLLIGIEAAAIEMRARGLEVHVAVADEPPDPVATVPGQVAVAMAYAVREALVNVAAHAGTGEAWVEVSLARPAAEPPPGTEPLRPAEQAFPGGLRVTIRDAGVGFDPAAVDPARLGLRRSIAERLADLGGRASVRSAPGGGTVVSLCWPAPSAVCSDTAGAGFPDVAAAALPDAAGARLPKAAAGRPDPGRAAW